jgi:transcriptional regulator with XRE-family HTH domain
MLSKHRFTEIVGINIKKIRQKKGWSQDKLSAECGFYRTSINLVETAKRTPSSYTLYRIAKALGVKVDQLYPSTV